MVRGRDTATDVSVLKIEAKGLTALGWGDSDKLAAGDMVMAIGCPFGINHTVSTGVVNAKGRSNIGIKEYENFIQTDDMKPGSAGGPLVNTRGEVIGVNAAMAVRSGSHKGTNFSIPSNSVKPIVKELLAEGRVRRAMLGTAIQDLTEALARSFGLEKPAGALVSSVLEGSAAEKAGIKEEDIIVKVGNAPIRKAMDVKKVVGVLKPGTATTVTVIRNGEKLTLSVVLGERKR
jgi:serine protease Do